MSTNRKIQMGRGLPSERPAEPAPTTTPLIEFPVYELAESQWDTRQVTGVSQHADDGSAEGVELTQADTTGERFVVVGTFEREPYDSRIRGRFNDPREALAQDALRLLLTTPPGAPDPRTTGRATAAHADGAQLTREYTAWSPTSWTVDGSTVSAVYVETGSGWMGFTGELPDLYVIAASSDTTFAGLTLRSVNTSGASPYSLTLASPYQVKTDDIG